MSDPVRTAACPILFWANGGRFDGRQQPIFDPWIVAYCNVPWDCGFCPFMKEWLDHLIAEQKIVVGWECNQCLKQTTEIVRSLPGFFHDGNCTRCNWNSAFLQLVLRYQPPTPVERIETGGPRTKYLEGEE